MLLLLAAFSLFLALFHVLPVIFDKHRLEILVREHHVDTFKFHRNLGIVAVVRMNIAVDVLLFLEDGIVSGDEEQKTEANQPE